MVKNPPANGEDSGLIPGSGISPRIGNDNLFQFFLLGESHGLCLPWSCKELDMTK